MAAGGKEGIAPWREVRVSQLGSARAQPGSACAADRQRPWHLQQEGAVTRGRVAPHASTGHKKGCQRGSVLLALRLLITSPNQPPAEGLSPGSGFSTEEVIFRDGAETHRTQQRLQPRPPHAKPRGAGAEGRAVSRERRVPRRTDTPPPARGREPLPFPTAPSQRGARLPPGVPAGLCSSPREAGQRRQPRSKGAELPAGRGRARSAVPARLPPPAPRTHRRSGACGRGPPLLSALSLELWQLEQEGSW